MQPTFEQILVTPGTFDRHLREISVQDTLVVDTETSGLSIWQGAEVAGYCIAHKGKSYYFPVAHRLPPVPESKAQADRLPPEALAGPPGALWPGQLTREQHDELLEVLAYDRRKVIFHNAKFDLAMIWGTRAPLVASKMLCIEDTMLLCKAVDFMSKANMTDAGKKWLGISNEVEEEEIKKKMTERGHTRRYSLLSPEDIAAYACSDAEVTWRLWHDSDLRARAEEQNVFGLYRQEMALMLLVLEMELRGVLCDSAAVDAAIEAGVPVRDRLLDTMRKLMAATGTPADHSAVPEPSRDEWIIEQFERLGISLKEISANAPGVQKDNAKKVRQGKAKLEVATTDEVLRMTNHPLGTAIRDWRTVEKMLGTYLLPFAGLKDHERAREQGGAGVHASFLQNGTITGRFSSSDPNLQNIPRAAPELIAPVSPEEQAAVAALWPKLYLGPRPGHVWLCYDYSQMEYRLLAFYCRDSIMLEAFNDGQDLHQRTADTINRILGEGTITRSHAKNVNFGMIYGLGAPGLAGLMEKPVDQVRGILDTYHDTFPSVRKFTLDVKQTALSRGYVRNLYGRRYAVDRGMEYKLVNYLIQGSCADLVKERMVALKAHLDATEGAFRRISAVVMQVHDEVVVEVPEEDAEARAGEFQKILEAMRDPTPLRKGVDVPMTVEAKIVRKCYAHKEDLNAKEG